MPAALMPDAYSSMRSEQPSEGKCTDTVAYMFLSLQATAITIRPADKLWDHKQLGAQAHSFGLLLLLLQLLLLLP